MYMKNNKKGRGLYATAQVIERQITKLPQTETKLAKKEISMLPRLFETEIHQPNKAMNRNINRNK